MKVLTILSPGFEEVEAVTVIDILRRAKIEVVTASLEDNQTVLGSHDMALIADQSLSDVIADALSNFDAIAIPGGMRGVRNMLAASRLVELVKAFNDAGKVCAAVCAGPLVLEAAGALKNRSFTCHPCVFNEITADGRVERAAVSDQNIVTGRAAGCALPWAIELVKKLNGSADDIMPGLAIL